MSIYPYRYEIRDVLIQGIMEMGDIEARDNALINIGIEFAAKKQFDKALNALSFVKSFVNMAEAFKEIAQYADGDQLKKICEAAKSTLNKGSRDNMKLGEMKMLPELLDKTLASLNAMPETIASL